MEHKAFIKKENYALQRLCFDCLLPKVKNGKMKKKKEKNEKKV